MQAEAIKPGQNVIVVDDLIATGELRNSLKRNIMNTSPVSRRFGESGWRAYRKTRREDPGIPFYHRAHVPQRSRQARWPSVFDCQIERLDHNTPHVALTSRLVI